MWPGKKWNVGRSPWIFMSNLNFMKVQLESPRFRYLQVSVRPSTWIFDLEFRRWGECPALGFTWKSSNHFRGLIFKLNLRHSYLALNLTVEFSNKPATSSLKVENWAFEWIFDCQVGLSSWKSNVHEKLWLLNQASNFKVEYSRGSATFNLNFLSENRNSQRTRVSC